LIALSLLLETNSWDYSAVELLVWESAASSRTCEKRQAKQRRGVTVTHLSLFWTNDGKNEEEVSRVLCDDAFRNLHYPRAQRKRPVASLLITVRPSAKALHFATWMS